MRNYMTQFLREIDFWLEERLEHCGASQPPSFAKCMLVLSVFWSCRSYIPISPIKHFVYINFVCTQ